MKSELVREVAFYEEHFRNFYQGLDKRAKLKSRLDYQPFVNS